MIELLVAADDRTGALETAAACADRGLGPVEVVVHPSVPRTDARVAVIDLCSRHAGLAVAGERAGSVGALTAVRHAHKVDSTLRGRWAHELVARQRVAACPVLLVPALPSMGRTCVRGEVLDGGRPVSGGPAADDVRAPIRSSRPAEHLQAAGAAGVAELTDVAHLERWLVRPTESFAVCDAVSDDDIEAIAHRWSGADDVLFAGTSASIGAAAGIALGALEPERPEAPAVRAPVLVVCGSLHPVARRQVAALAAAGAAVGKAGGALGWAADALATGRPTVVCSPAAPRGAVSDGDAATVARDLGAAARRLLDAVDVATLVLIGGDAAAAVLGDEARFVGGSVAPGVAWSRVLDGSGPLVLTRAGGFGAVTGLLELLAEVLVA